MAQRWAPLTDGQLDVLRWIADGCPDGVMEGHLHKISAVALENRRLVRVRKSGGIWTVELTDDGSYYLAHGDYVQRLKPAKAASRLSLSAPESRTDSVSRSEPTASVTPATRTPRAVAPTEQLVLDIQSAGGRLAIPTDYSDRRRIESLVKSANRFRKAPNGYRLVITGSWRDGQFVEIEPLPSTASTDPIPVPERIGRYHLVAALFRDQRHLNVVGAARTRALRITHVLCTEAERRGYVVTGPRLDATSAYYNSHPVHIRFSIAIGDFTNEVRVNQQSDRSEHAPTAAERADQSRYSWRRIPKYDYSPADRLTVELEGYSSIQQSKWGDTKRSEVIHKLNEVLLEIEMRGVQAEAHRRAEIERLERRKVQWAAAMEQAKVHYREDFYAQTFDAQREAWEKAQQQREFIVAMTQAVEVAEPNEREDALRWLDWVREHIRDNDPLIKPLRIPDAPEPRPDDLQPFLKGWSAYGP